MAMKVDTWINMIRNQSYQQSNGYSKLQMYVYRDELCFEPTECYGEDVHNLLERMVSSILIKAGEQISRIAFS